MSSEAAGDALNVLALLEVLHTLGSRVEDPAVGALIDALDEEGIHGITADQEPLFLLIGSVLRLLLRHANAVPEAMFTATRQDLLDLGRAVEP